MQGRVKKWNWFSFIEICPFFSPELGQDQSGDSESGEPEYGDEFRTFYPFTFFFRSHFNSFILKSVCNRCYNLIMMQLCPIASFFTLVSQKKWQVFESTSTINDI
jgi:hypothetical protein